jgi:3-hydroxy-9,10-secoandrosta-1,3,5(10)-triene-9,17-dione monooxygenase
LKLKWRQSSPDRKIRSEKEEEAALNKNGKSRGREQSAQKQQMLPLRGLARGLSFICPSPFSDRLSNSAHQRGERQPNRRVHESFARFDGRARVRVRSKAEYAMSGLQEIMAMSDTASAKMSGLDVGARMVTIHASVGSREDLVRRAQALVPALRSRAAEADTLRRLPPETVRDLKSTGVARILQPSRYGGCEAPFAGMVDILRTIASGCGSTAWCLAQYIGHNFMVSQWRPAAQEAVWGSAPDNLVSGILIPLLGRATKVADGYRISGQWPFVSGVNHSDWCFLSGMVANGNEGTPEERYFLVPRAQVTIVPTWDAIGLHGSGSDDIKVEELFVPEHMTLPIGSLKGGETPGNRLHPAALYRSPSYMWFGILLASASLGMAEGMLSDYVAEAKKRTALMTGQETRSLMSQHIKVAEAVAALASARAVIYTTCAEIMTILEAGALPDDEQRTRYRCVAAYAGKLTFAAANAIWDAEGGRGVYLKNHIGREYRNLCTATRHVTHNWDFNAAAHGRVKLGLPLDNPSL